MAKEVKMRKLQYSSKLYALMSALLLTSCSSQNVSGEWDCPRQKGHGCINIELADSIALQKLAERNQPAETLEVPKRYVAGHLQEIWFAPHIDSSGHLHEASVIKYRLEEL